jgi:hypothetical protein
MATLSGSHGAEATGQARTVCDASSLDFRLNPGGKAVDAGAALPTINGDFTGKAPDLGALETGKPVPVHGPRGANKQPFYQ